MKYILFMVSLLLAAMTAFAQTSSRTFEHRIASESLSDERIVTVQVPESYAKYASSRFPVLILLDGENNLAHAGPVTDFLAESGRIPEMIVVGVHSGATRSQDFLPPVAGLDGASAQAGTFLSFLEKELVPFIETEYRTAPLRILSGHSLGGLFVTWAMASGSSLAHAWLAQSPYLVPPAGAGVLADVGGMSAGNESAGSGSAASKSAASESAGSGSRAAELEHAGHYYHTVLGAEPDLSTNFDLLEGRLSDLDRGVLEWHLERLPSESHMSTRLIGLYEGISGYFEGNWSMSSENLMEGGTDGLAAHIDRLSTTYGYPVLFSEQPFQELTQRYLQQRDVASAREAATLYVENHDPSVVAHFMLGVSLASSGNPAEALSEIRRAMALHEADPDPELAPVYGQLQQLRRQLED